MEKVWEWSTQDKDEWQLMRSSFYDTISPVAKGAVGAGKTGYFELRVPLLFTVDEQRKLDMKCCAYLQHGSDRLRIGVVVGNLSAQEYSKLLILVNNIDKYSNRPAAL